jgi:hypothetical protein
LPQARSILRPGKSAAGHLPHDQPYASFPRPFRAVSLSKLDRKQNISISGAMSIKRRAGCGLSDASVPGRFDQMIRRTECKSLNGECGMIPATSHKVAAVHDEQVGYVVRAVVFIYH